MTVHSSRSFHISWRAGPYVCYSAEWTRRGQEAAFKSFCSQDNYKMVYLKSEWGGATLCSRLLFFRLRFRRKLNKLRLF